MPLTLEQYATDYLPTRGLPWPAAPKHDPVKAKPYLVRLPVKGVLWTVYGTLLSIPDGEIRYEHAHEFVTDAALDKTLKEFNMWNSMSRKPGAPASHLKEMVNKALTNLRLTGSGGEKFPEVVSERVWDDVIGKLQQKDYKFDVSLYGSKDDYAKKMAYFYHASIQGVGAYPGAAEAVLGITGRCQNGLLADGQAFTPAQLQKAFREQNPAFDVTTAFPPALRILSTERKARKPSETLFRAAVEAVSARGLKPADVLHIGSSLTRDIGPAKKFGFRTALFAGDKTSLVATPEQLKAPEFRPDVMLTELTQILDVIG